MAKKRKSFMDLLGSPLVLVPFTLGVGSAIVIWSASDKNHRLAAFLAIVGSLGALGTLLTLLVLYSGGLDPVLQRKRQEMLAGLEDLADASKFGPSPETDHPAAAALLERG